MGSTCHRLGTLAQLNPPIRDVSDRDALWQTVRPCWTSWLTSPPHALEEKSMSRPRSPSAMPVAQTLVPVMLTHVNAGRLSLERFVDLTCAGPRSQTPGGPLNLNRQFEGTSRAMPATVTS
jgi:dihydroorotase